MLNMDIKVFDDKYTIECKHGRCPVLNGEKAFCMICDHEDQKIGYKQKNTSKINLNGTREKRIWN